MKRFGIVALILIIGGLVYYLAKDREEKPQEIASTTANEYPPMLIANPDGSQVTLTELKGNNIIVFFQPDCDHCQREAKAIADNIEGFSEYQLYFISLDDFNLMNEFATEFGLAGKSNVSFGRTTLDDILNNLGRISPPSLYIYREGKLIKHLDGEKDIVEILRYI